MNLFINQFEHENKERQKELDFCFDKNRKNKHIKNIVIVNKGDRATYGDFFRAMQGYPDDVNIIANLDIYFDDTIQHANEIQKRHCYALTRWEYVAGNVMSFNQRHGRPSPPQWSQDAWIFRGWEKPERFDFVDAKNLDTSRPERIPFSLGVPGCDNKIVAILKQVGYNVSNPSMDIKAIHVHRNDHRVYPRYQILSGIKPFGMVYQSKL